MVIIITGASHTGKRCVKGTYPLTHFVSADTSP